MSYKFVRIRRRNSGQYGTWYFKPMSKDDVQLHWDTICAAQMKEHVHERFSKAAIADTGILWPHPTTEFGMAVDAFLEGTNKNYAIGMLEIENEAYRTRMRSFDRGQDIYLSNGMTVLVPDERVCEIVETVEVEKFAYPEKKEWSMADVKFMQWNMLGNVDIHWYAKVGSYDIRDKDGNMKWDTKPEAEDAARWYITEKLGGTP